MEDQHIDSVTSAIFHILVTLVTTCAYDMQQEISQEVPGENNRASVFTPGVDCTPSTQPAEKKIKASDPKLPEDRIPGLWEEFSEDARQVDQLFQKDTASFPMQNSIPQQPTQQKTQLENSHLPPPPILTNRPSAAVISQSNQSNRVQNSQPEGTRNGSNSRIDSLNQSLVLEPPSQSVNVRAQCEEMRHSIAEAPLVTPSQPKVFPVIIYIYVFLFFNTNCSYIRHYTGT